ncbi:MAG: DUF58 domain-containing protein [Acetobacteraceae bacterium]|nr:DUF58 domain-containing protein [Acetobacteraceae bacterium]
MTTSPSRHARRAEALGARLPPLLVAAQRVAATVAQGVHGRRRVGQGDSFWQYRPFLPGDIHARIDWRASAKSDRSFIRETEWEAAQTVYMWRDSSPSMDWRSGSAVPFKRERAELLLLALASLLLRGGERVRLIGGPLRFRGGAAALEDLAEGLGQIEGSGGMPPDARLPRHARIVLIGDFLAPLAEIQATVDALSAIPVSGYMLQVLDAAEALLPYSGRVRFRGLEHEADELVPHVEGIREGYAQALAHQLHGLANLCTAAGWGFGTHRTDHAPETALLSMYVALASHP